MSALEGDSRPKDKACEDRRVGPHLPTPGTRPCRLPLAPRLSPTRCFARLVSDPPNCRDGARVPTRPGGCRGDTTSDRTLDPPLSLRYEVRVPRGSTGQSLDSRPIDPPAVLLRRES